MRTFKSVLALAITLLTGVVYAGQPVTEAGPRMFYEQSSAPSTLSNIVTAYGCEYSSVTELCTKDSAGNVTQITSGGSIAGGFLKLDQTTPQTVTGTPTFKATTSDGSTNILNGVDSGNTSRIKVDSNGATTITSDSTSDFALSVVDNRASGYSNILSFLAPLAPSGTVMRFGTDATHNSSWTWDSATSTMGYQTYANAYPFEFQGSYSRFASTTASLFLNAPSGAGGTEYARMDNATKTFAIGTTDLDGTPAIGRIVAEGTTSDGSTNILVGRDSSHNNVFVLNTDGDTTQSGIINTTNIKTADTLGSDITTDGGLEVWSTGSTLTSWVDSVGGPGSPTLAQESTPANVYAGTYSAKFTTDAATDAGIYIVQQLTGLTPSDYYRASFYAKESTSTGLFQILYLNGELGVATQVFHFTGASAGTWVNGTGAGGIVDPTGTDIGPTTMDDQTLTNVWALKTASLDVPVPANGTIWVAIIAQGAGGVALDLYLDKITFQKVTYGVNANLFDLKSSQDPSTYTSSDSIFKIENTGGATNTWLQVKGDGLLYVDGVDTDEVITQSIEIGSGNDLDITMGDDAGANVISFKNLSGVEKLTINSFGDISAPSNKTLIIGVNDQGTADAEGVGMTIRTDGGGTGGTGNHNGGDLRIELGAAGGVASSGKLELKTGTSIFGRIYSDTGSRLLFSGNESSGTTAVAVTLGASEDYIHAGSKLLAIVDNMGAGMNEKLAVDYTGAIVWPQYATGVIKTVNGDAGTNNPGGDIYILAGKAGSFTTGSYGGTVNIQAGNADGAGNNNGGSITLQIGSASGTGVDGSIGFYKASSAFGFMYKHPTATIPIWAGNVNDGASAVGLIVGPSKNLTTAGSKLIQFSNYVGNAGGTEKAYVDYRGTWAGGDGTALLPGMSFLSDPSTGFYRVDSGKIGFSSNGTLRATFEANGALRIGSSLYGSTSATSPTFQAGSNDSNQLRGQVADGSTAIANKIGNINALLISGAKILSLYSNNFSTEVGYFSRRGMQSWGQGDTLQIHPQEYPATALTATLSTGGSVDAGSHSYKVTFVTANGETNAGTASTAVVNDVTNNRNLLTAIPIGGSKVTARKIYRNSVGDATTFRLLQTIANNTATTATDDATDASIAAAATIPTINTTANQIRILSADVAGGKGLIIDTSASYSNSKLLSIQNNATEKVYANYDGTLYNAGGRIVNVTDVNAATYDLLTSDYFLSVSYTTTGAVTSLTLPTAQCVNGRTIVVKDPWGKAGTNNITIDTEGAELIDGQDTYTMNVNWQSINLICYSSNWYVH